MNVDFRRKVTISLTCLLLIFCTSYALGQGIVTGSISGTVVDPQGAVIVGANVTARNTATNQETSDVSSASGAFQLRQLPPGTYELSVQAPNFQKLSVKAVAVRVGVDTAMGALKLTVGATSETVTVEATTPLVETQTSQLSTTFDAKQTTDLPIGNAFDSLVLLVPGAANPGDVSFSNSNGPDISMNGQRGRSNNFQIDGQSNNDNSVAGPSLFFGNQDTISEIQVVSNNFSAEYGRNMGSVVNYLTKSGTNSFHGDLFEFFTGNFTFSKRNQEKSSLFGFCPPLTPGEPCDTPDTGKFVENRFGGTIGGPILRDKMWFFASLMKDEVAQNFVVSSGSNHTPTPDGLLLLENTYCGVAFTVYTPTPCPSHPALGGLLSIGPYGNPNGNPRPGNVSLLNVTDGVTPLAGVPFASVSRSILGSSTDWETMGRIDWQISQKDRFFGRYNFQDLLFLGGTGRFSAGAWVDEPGRTQQIALDWVHTFTDHVINQARFSYSRAFFGFEGQSGAPAGFGDCTVKTYGSCATGFTMVDNEVSFGFQSNLPQDRLVNNSQWQDNLSWVHGKHTFKFGGEYDRQRSPNSFLPNGNGTYRFNDINALLANTPVRLDLAVGTLQFNFKEQDAAFYAQDDWRIRDNVTLNLGIRWEYTEQAINLLHDLTVARETGPNPFWNPALPLADRTQAAVPNDTNNWGPAVGFSYTPRIWPGLFGRDKTVIRGGYRIAYDPAYYNIFANVATAAPTVDLGTITGASSAFPAGAFTGAATITAKGVFIPIGCATNACDPRRRSQTTVQSDFHNPYSEQWSLGVQRELTSKMVLEVRYVGNHTIGNFQTVNINPRVDFLAANFPSLIPGGITECTDNTQPGFRRINCDRGVIRSRNNSAFSNYNGLQSELRIRNWHNLTGGVEYTWSKGMDNVSEIFSTGAGGNTVAGAQNFFNIDRAERGVSGTSYTHVLTTWFIYQFPWYKSQQGFLGHLLGGWQANGIYQYHTGQPFTPSQFSEFFSPNSSCDETFALTFYGLPTCRPILNDPTAPLDTIGICTTTTGNCNPADLFGPSGFGFCSTNCATQFHWLLNDNTAALAFGNPFLGVGRNTLRGQSFNNLDFSLYKDIKVTERTQFQLQFNTFNILNRQFRGVPDPIDLDLPFADGDCQASGSGCPGSFMNNLFNGSGRRSMTFGIKFIF